jgi:hypothetical protein
MARGERVGDGEAEAELDLWRAMRGDLNGGGSGGAREIGDLKFSTDWAGLGMYG